MSKEVKVGITVLLGLALLFFSIIWAKDLRVTGQRYRIHFSNVSGLQIGDPVMLSGLKVGKVEEILVDAPGVLVWVSLPTDLAVYRNAEARLMMLELMTGKKIELNPGLPETGRLSSDVPIRGSFVSDIPELIGFAGMTVDTLKILLTDMQRTLSNANRLLESEEMNTDLRITLHNLRIITEDLTHITGDIKRVKIAETVLRLEQTLEQANRFLSEVQPEVTSSLSEFRTTAASVNELLIVIKPILEDLKSRRQTLVGKMLYDTLFAARLESAIVELDSVLNLGKSEGIKVKLKVF